VGDFSSRSTVELLSTIAECQAELRRRGVIRSSNVTGDLAETIVCAALGLMQVPASGKNVDAVGADGRRYQIKARQLTTWNKSRQLGSLRDLAAGDFDFLVGVLFDQTYRLMRAALVPHSIVVARAGWMPRNNAHRFHLIDTVWGLPGVVDITSKLDEAMMSFAMSPALAPALSAHNGV
jgi:hypothetical protein